MIGEITGTCVFENGTALVLSRDVPERSINTISMSVLRVILHATMVAATSTFTTDDINYSLIS